MCVCVCVREREMLSIRKALEGRQTEWPTLLSHNYHLLIQCLNVIIKFFSFFSFLSFLGLHVIRSKISQYPSHWDSTDPFPYPFP